MAIQDNRAIERGDTIEINEGDKEVDIEELIASTKNQTSSKWWKVEQRDKQSCQCNRSDQGHLKIGLI